MAYDMDRLKKVDPKFIHFEQTAAIPAPHREPRRIHVASNNTIYLAAGAHLSALTRDGRQTLDLATGADIRALTVAQDGTIYVALRDSIAVYDPKGQKLRAWQSPGKKSWFTSIAISGEDLFASDAANRIVWHFDLSGKLRGRIGEKSPVTRAKGFLVPSPYFDLEIGPDNLLWVVNPGHHQIECYSFEGRLQSSWGDPSFGLAGFCGCCNPSYFTRLADGRFVTSEKGLPRIKVYSPEGQFESVVAAPDVFPKYFENPNSNPLGIDVAADASGRILVADPLQNQIRVFERKKERAA